MKQPVYSKFFLLFLILLLILSSPGLSYAKWSPWKGADGWIGLDYRLQSGKVKSGEWKFRIQFRNRYSQRIHFDINVENGRGSNRVTINANKKETFSMYYTKDNYILFFVDKVRFGDDNKLEAYATPDQF